MKSFLEFYFPGIDLGAKCEREVSSRDVDVIASIANNYPYAISCRFYDRNGENKENYSPRYWLGKEYSCKEFKSKFSQFKDNTNLLTASRIVQTRSGGFYPLDNTDVVLSV